MKHVLVEAQGRLGLITLNRPEALNALSTAMVQDIARALDHFEADKHIRSVALISSVKKAFCSGGDVRVVVLQAKEDPAAAAGFFRAEYRLNHRIATYSKRLLVIVDGLCMGGGLGLAVHAPYCLATERAVFAMPETAIGLFPDVGAAHFLNRNSRAVANWIALTGARLEQGDAMLFKLVSSSMRSKTIPMLLKGLSDGALFADDFPEEPAALSAPFVSLIERCFSLPDPVAVMQQIRTELKMATQPAQVEWLMAQQRALQKASPTSLLITMQHLEQSRGQTLQNVLESDFRLACAFLRHPDFAEGVRAQLIDKDHQPRWQSKIDLAPFSQPPFGGPLFS